MTIDCSGWGHALTYFIKKEALLNDKNRAHPEMNAVFCDFLVCTGLVTFRGIQTA